MKHVGWIYLYHKIKEQENKDEHLKLNEACEFAMGIDVN